MAIRKQVKRRKKIISAPKECYFHKEGKEPKYSDVEVLRRYLSDRGRIIGRTRSGLCAKDQRKLTRAIKHARHLALLPFIGSHR